MTGLLLTIALAAAPLKMAAPGLAPSGLPPDRAEFLSGYVATQVALAGVKVVSSKEIAAIIGMERQKELLGCKDSSQCLEEIAAALGTDALLVGDVALFGGRYVATLKVVRSSNGQTVAIQTVEAANEADFLEALRGASARLAADALQAFGLEAVSLGNRGPSRYWAAIPLGLAVLAGSSTPFLFGQANTNFTKLTDNAHVGYQEALDARNDGQALQMTGVIMAITAGVMLAAAVVWWFAIGAPP
ncbi:MAG: hypothetical protein QM723_40805 [Myxococcaceae bacterium]